MGFLLIFGGMCFIACLIAFLTLLAANNDFSPGLLVITLAFAALATVGGMAEYKAKDSCVITIKEYRAFKIERINVSCEKAMLIRETHYNYPRYSIFYSNKAEYKILGIEE